MPKPPKELDVSYTTIKVRVSKELEDDHGLYLAAKKLVRLAEDSCEGPEGVNTLLHELLHAGYDLGSLRNPDLSSDAAKADEERVVTVLANLLTELFSRNPRVLKWIAAELRSG